jgi:hypothetical protein
MSDDKHTTVVQEAIEQVRQVVRDHLNGKISDEVYLQETTRGPSGPLFQRSVL